ncbi:hypothetical protein H8959_010539 [Pygathrix nigripes]
MPVVPTASFISVCSCVQQGREGRWASPQMLWLLLLTLPCLGGSMPRNPGESTPPNAPSAQDSLPALGSERQPCRGRGDCLIAGLSWEELEACAFRVQVGQLRLYEDDQPTKVVEIVRHPLYNESLSAQGGVDIALLKLEAPVPLSELVHPVLLPAYLPGRALGEDRLGDRLG